VLGARNVELQGLLVDAQGALHAPTNPEATDRPESAERLLSAERIEILAMLRALFRRMLERELQVTAPPTARK